MSVLRRILSIFILVNFFGLACLQSQGDGSSGKDTVVPVADGSVSAADGSDEMARKLLALMEDPVKKREILAVLEAASEKKEEPNQGDVLFQRAVLLATLFGIPQRIERHFLGPIPGLCATQRMALATSLGGLLAGGYFLAQTRAAVCSGALPWNRVPLLMGSYCTSQVALGSLQRGLVTYSPMLAGGAGVLAAAQRAVFSTTAEAFTPSRGVVVPRGERYLREGFFGRLSKELLVAALGTILVPATTDLLWGRQYGLRHILGTYGGALVNLPAAFPRIARACGYAAFTTMLFQMVVEAKPLDVLSSFFTRADEVPAASPTGAGLPGGSEAVLPKPTRPWPIYKKEGDEGMYFLERVEGYDPKADTGGGVGSDACVEFWERNGDTIRAHEILPEEL